MDKILMFVYVIVLFLLLFLVENNVDAINCETDADCPQIPILHPMVYRCINYNCVFDRGEGKPLIV
uniref:Nodule-specific cysteine-rich peptide G21 n=1 Tax=Pisum sativum TaxID=3888 RepID=A0A7T8IFZ9_PEA|nr:nodule-specific cysteine-rich peptide G21 [Pisum sativum]